MAKHILQEMLEELSHDVRSYSGRGMYGKKCLAIDVGQGFTPGFLAAEIIGLLVLREGLFMPNDPTSREQVLEELQEGLRNMTSDQMGKGMILYFPDVPFENTDKSGETEEDLG